MAVWDDLVEERGRLAPDAPEPPLSAQRVEAERSGSVSPDLRDAAEREAADIVDRARAEIRRIIVAAEHQLQELTAQLDAADIHIPAASLPTLDTLEAEETSSIGGVWASRVAGITVAQASSLRGAPQPTAGGATSIFGVADTIDEEEEPTEYRASRQSARLFVAAFALVGLGIVLGTAWWLTRAPNVPSRMEHAAPDTRTPQATPDVAPVVDEHSETSGSVSDQFQVLAPPELAHGEVSVRPVGLEAGTVLQEHVPGAMDGAVAAGSPRGERSVPTNRPSASSSPGPSPAAAVSPFGSRPASASGPGEPPSGQTELTSASREWLDAYHRQNRGSLDNLGAPSFVINDERLPAQRFPFGLEVSRSFEDEQLQLAGDSALFTARVTERAPTGALVTRVIQTWVRRSGEWRLQEARLAHEGLAPSAPR